MNITQVKALNIAAFLYHFAHTILRRTKSVLSNTLLFALGVILFTWSGGCVLAEPYSEESGDTSQNEEPFQDDDLFDDYDEDNPFDGGFETDECPEDPDKIEPGICGCGVSDEDSDDDGTADCYDDCPDDAFKIEPGECGCGQDEGTCGICPQVLNSKERLYVGEFICSENGNFQFGMLENGDLALQSEDEILWTADISDGFYAHMQIDGNLVIYNTDMQSLWASNTSGNPDAYLTVENDSQVIIWSNGQIAWSIGGNK